MQPKNCMSLDFFYKAFRVAHDDATTKGYKKNHGGVSQVKCPVCDGVLRYAVAASNGRMHAKCETVGCVQWMD